MFEIATQIGHIISIHTDTRWGGRFEDITRAKLGTDKSIMAKGIHASDEEVEEAFKSGADFVLVVGRVPDANPDKCIIEPNSLQELADLPPEFGNVVWNSRDLSTGGLKRETFAEAREVLPYPKWLCQASNIKTLADIEPTANAILVGTHLEALKDELTKHTP